VGHFLCKDEDEALGVVKRYLSFLPSNWTSLPPTAAAAEAPGHAEELIPDSERRAFDMRKLVKGLLDGGDYFEIQARWAKELTIGFGRLNGQVIGVVGNNSLHKGGVLFVDSADKASRFVQLCDAFNVPLLFLADVPGFMVGSAVERQGIIRHGAKMVSAISEATVPKICVVVRKAYGAGLYAMAGPGFMPDATIALPTAKIAVMGAEAAVNAVYANKIAALPESEREGFIAAKRAEYEIDIDLVRLASELVIDAIVAPEDLRDELIRRFTYAANKDRHFSRRRHGVTPV
jgi:acetyl-CoA carboxylase carboxyltransferase component